MASHDYFMRQVEGMTDALSMLLFDRAPSRETGYEIQIAADHHALLQDLRLKMLQGDINGAENLLFERMQESGEDLTGTAALFYDWLERLTDMELSAADFTRAEIKEGREAVQYYYERKRTD